MSFLLSTGSTVGELPVVRAGNSGNYILKPTIKFFDIEESGAMISGNVIGQGTAEGLGDTNLSLQTYDSLADDDEAVSVIASTRSDSSVDGAREVGYYSILAQTVEPASHNLVAYKDAYGPQCVRIDLEPGESLMQDFELSTVDEVTLTQTVSIDTDEEVTISVRISLVCEVGGSEQTVELLSESFVDDGTGEFTYSYTVPAGAYVVEIRDSTPTP